MNAWNSTLKTSRRPLKRSRLERGTKPMNKIGPRTDAWLRVWRWLKPRLEAAGRTRCEFPFIEHECCGILDPCHSKKRRLMRGPDIFAVALGCRSVHELLDLRMTHEQMEVAVMRAIEEHGGLILPERY